MLYAGDLFYMRAFRDLGTTRQLGMAMGPIPYDRIVEYGHNAGLDRVMIAVLVEFIIAMDGPYREWCADEAEKRSKQRRIGNVEKDVSRSRGKRRKR